MKRKSTVISIVSGKGGVGKSIVGVNLAEVLASGGHSVALVDADFGQGACRILLNESPGSTLLDVADHVRLSRDVMHRTASGITLVEAATEPGQAEHRLYGALDQIVAELRSGHEFVLIDTPAGVDGPVRWALDRADLGLLVLVGEPTAIADAYRLTKMIWQVEPGYPFGTVVNFADSEEDARGVVERFNKVTSHFVGPVTNFLGWIPFSAVIRQSVADQTPVVRNEGPVRAQFERIAGTIAEDL
jgi:flagellar biosynthesis protein FlhG